MAAGEELLALIDREIPEGRKSLQENFMNLENVARYCEENYQRAGPNEKSEKLQETKNYTTHSLASVAYQINNLATNFLKLLDLQQSQLTDMESSVNHLNQIVMIHKEKVARREIGELTSSRNVPRPIGMKNGIIYPDQRERPIKYTRKQIDYSVLDDIGHGIRTNNQQQGTTPRATRSPSISSTHSNVSSNANNNQAPTSKPPTPPIVYKAGGGTGSGGSTGGTIGRSAGGHYRSLGPPVAPPVAPNTPPISVSPFQQPGNNANYQAFPTVSSRSSVSSGGSYSPSSTLVMGAVHSPPILGGIGITVPSEGYGFPHHIPAAHNLARPMAPPLMQHHDPMVHPRISSSSIRGQSMIETSITSLPPPPPDDFEDSLLASPPPPPPPAADLPDQFDYGSAPPPPPDFSDERAGPPSMRDGMAQPIENDIYGTAHGPSDDPYAATGPQFLHSQTSWVPKHYLEKVVAIYDYQANKGDELSFAENAIVYVIHKNDDGWWEGVMDGKTGLFPYNYVEPCI